jgi:peptidoglycan/xylan/chitin deacetylase (PgdA/CDA1 family)
MFPLVALGVGSWLGLGRPAIPSAIAACAWPPRRVVVSSPRSEVPPLDDRESSIDGSAVPDPTPPWPPLNPDDSVDRAWLIAEGPAHVAGDGRRLVTFTFDDGPFPETAPTLLRILSDHKIHATFFLIGEYLSGDDRRASESREWAKRIADAGHALGNHTLHHRALTRLSHATALAEIDDSAAAIERATGVRPSLFRPPYGALDGWLEGALRDRHLELVLWNIDVRDIRRTDPDEIAQSLEDQLEYKQGGIVLLHDMHWASVRAFSRLLRHLEASRWDPEHPERNGWDIVDLAEYLRATDAAPQPFATRDALVKARRSTALARGRPDP